MWSAASFLFRCARCSGTPVWVRGSRSSRRCPYRAAVPPEGGRPPGPGGAEGRACGSPAVVGAGGGGGVGGPPPRPPSGLCGGGGGGRAAASLLSFRAAACGTPFWLSPCRRRAHFRRARAVGAEVPPRGGGGEGRPVDRPPGGPI